MVMVHRLTAHVLIPMPPSVLYPTGIGSRLNIHWPRLGPFFVPERVSRWRALAPSSTYHPSARRCLHANSGHRPSRHAQFYSDLIPAMIPVALLGSAVYMVRQLLLIRS
jgi:hypothetical protein